MDVYHHRAEMASDRAHTPQLRDMVAELEADKRRLQRNSTARAAAARGAVGGGARREGNGPRRRERELEAQLACLSAAGETWRLPGSSRPASAPRRRSARPWTGPPVRLSAEGIREPVRVSIDDRYDDRYVRPFAPATAADVGVVTDLNALEEFVVSSKFV